MVAVPAALLLGLSVWIAVWRGAGAGSGNALTNLPDARKYCIVGAGAGGLQLGQFMQHRGRDYATFERRDRAATFFDKYPVHRKLISINKRYTGRDNANFNMRHDWNSLLESEVPQMTTRTKERFPPAAVLAEYLRDFAKLQEEAGRIFYGITVEEIARDDNEGFVLSVQDARHPSAEAVQVACEVVIACTGVGSANVPPNLDVPGAYGCANQPHLLSVSNTCCRRFACHSLCALAAGAAAAAAGAAAAAAAHQTTTCLLRHRRKQCSKTSLLWCSAWAMLEWKRARR
jgi:hypothetical protein